jgi:hypothetical protein
VNLVVATFLCLYITLINILEKVQIEAMRNISGGTRLTPLRESYKETGLLRLKDIIGGKTISYSTI